MNKDFEISHIDLRTQILVAYKGNDKIVQIPDDITAIGNHAFLGCNTVEKIIFGKDVKSVSFEPFCHCPNLKEIVFNEGMEYYETCFIDSCPKLTEITLPQSLTHIATGMFGYQNHQIKVNIPDNLEVLYNSAFDWLDENNNIIPYDKTLFLENPNYEIQNGIFVNKKNHTALFCAETDRDVIEIPEGIEKIAKHCFIETPLLNWENNQDCYLEEEAEFFRQQKHIKKLYLPKSVKKIDAEAFRYCVKFEEIYFDNSSDQVEISSEAFFGTPQPKMVFAKATSAKNESPAKNENSEAKHRATFAMLERLTYIHQKIKSGTYPNTNDLLASCRKNLMLAGEHLSTSTISRDIDRLKNVFNAPIVYDRFERGYYYEKDFDLEIENSNWIMGM